MSRSAASTLPPDAAARHGGPADPPPLVSLEDEARQFWRMRLRIAWTHCRQTLATGRFRLALVLALGGLLWLTLFWLSSDAFVFLRSAVPSPRIYDDVVAAMFGMFFFWLMVMLTFSTAIILYGALFRSADVPLLLSLPMSEERIFLAKYQEAILLSSWGFLILGSPSVIAYGLVSEAPWTFYLLLLPFMAAFAYIPGGVAAIACVVVMRLLPRARMLALVLVGGLAVLAAGAMGWSVTNATGSDLMTSDWFQEMLGRLKIVEHRLLPSWWLSEGLLGTARGNARESLMFLVLLVANAVFLRMLAAATARGLFRTAYSRLQGLGTCTWTRARGPRRRSTGCSSRRRASCRSPDGCCSSRTFASSAATPCSGPRC